MHQTVSVDLGDRAYEIKIGPGLLSEAGRLIAPFLPTGTTRRRVFVITDETVAALHLGTLEAALRGVDVDIHVLKLSPGEATKGWDSLQKAVEWLIAARAERSDLVVAFGGGVIGDLAGFAAAIQRRGMRFVQIPTTLLAQVDSSVGGKTGINSPQGKNLVGAFHQPVLVIADTGLLATLPPREFRAGYAEVVKYGLLGDASFFTWLEDRASDLAAGDAEALVAAVRRSCEMKAEIVVEDEQEAGRRALLNLGHTFGHALEAATGYSDRLLHGEGVAIGMGLAAELSSRLGLIAQETPSRIRAHFAELGLPLDLADIPGALPDAEGLLDLMAQDKKVSDGQLTFILLREIGDAFTTRDVPRNVVKSLLAETLEAHASTAARQDVQK